MIKTILTNIPQVLHDNHKAWTDELLLLVNQHGGYDKIPKESKDKAVNKYRHSDIQDSVIAMTKGKCVFCESFIETVDYPNIEHFHPKSLYPEHAFEWGNLFPSCRKCNIPKGNTDTKNTTPLIHPSNDDGEEYFEFKELKIHVKAAAPNRIMAANTIKSCDLHRITLSRQYSELQLAFYSVERNLDDIIEHYNTLAQNAAKIKLALQLQNAIDNLKDQSGYFKQYSGFMRHLIRNSPTISSSLQIINLHKEELGLSADYDFGWV